MSVSLDNLPRDPMNCILSNLNASDICSFSEVSKKCYKAANRILIWKNLCKNYMDVRSPILDKSWKDTYIINHNWRSGRAEVRILSYVKRDEKATHGLTFTENEVPYEIIPPSNNKKYFRFKNLNNNSITKGPVFNVNAQSSLDFCVNLGSMFVLDSTKTIHRYDIASGKELYTIDPKEQPGSGRVIYSGHELATYYDNKIRLWDIDQKKVKEEYDVTILGPVIKFAVTTHFIICKAFLGNSSCVKIINRDPQNINPKVYDKYNSFDVDGSKIIYYSKEKSLVSFYKEDNDLKRLTFIRSFHLEVLSNPSSAVVKIVNNWAMISRKGLFQIFNVKDGSEISRFVTSKQQKFDFAASFSKLLLRNEVLIGQYFSPGYQYTQCDFSKNITKLNFSDVPRQASRCNVQ
jgi:hypothetical protein